MTTDSVSPPVARAQRNGIAPANASNGASRSCEVFEDTSGGLAGWQVGWLVVLTAGCIGCGAVTGAAVGSQLARQYAARSEIVHPVDREAPTGFLRTDRALSTQLVLIRSNAVLDAIAERSGTTPAALRKRVSAAVVEDSEVIRIQVRARTGEEAVRLNQEVVDGYVPVATAGSRRQIELLSTELQGLDTKLTDAATRREALFSGTAKLNTREAAAERIDEEIAASRAREGAVQAQLDQLNRDGLRVVTQPYALDEPVHPRPWVHAAAGALLGLLIAVGAGAVQVRRWSRRPSAR